MVDSLGFGKYYKIGEEEESKGQLGGYSMASEEPLFSIFQLATSPSTHSCLPLDIVKCRNCSSVNYS